MAVRVAITARTRRRDVDLGVRTIAVDVEVDAGGTAAVSGASARLVAWWGTE